MSDSEAPAAVALDDSIARHASEPVAPAINVGAPRNWEAKSAQALALWVRVLADTAATPNVTVLGGTRVVALAAAAGGAGALAGVRLAWPGPRP